MVMEVGEGESCEGTETSQTYHELLHVQTVPHRAQH